MTDTGIEMHDDRAAGRLRAREGGVDAGRIEYFAYRGQPAALVPVHTVVVMLADEGRGIAGALARELYTLAAREGLAVIPLCPYVAAWAERHPDLAPEVDPELVTSAREQLAADPGKL